MVPYKKASGKAEKALGKAEVKAVLPMTNTRTLAEVLSSKPQKTAYTPRDYSAQAWRVRTDKFPMLTDLQWREMVDDEGVKLSSWVETVIRDPKNSRKKLLPSHHKEALQRWPIMEKPSDKLPDLDEEDLSSVETPLQKKLVKAIAKFRNPNPAQRETSSLASFLDEQSELPAKLLHGLIVEMECDEIVTKSSRRTLVTCLLQWLARTIQINVITSCYGA